MNLPLFEATFALLITAAACSGGEQHNISLVVMAPFPDAEQPLGWDEGPSLYPAAVVAAREINNNSEILPGFNLRLIKVDSGCSVVSKVTISFLRDIFENRDHQVVGIIGPGCSGAAVRVANLTARKQISLIHITPSATSPRLGDPLKRNTYATISSALSYVQSFIELMNSQRWTEIATLQDEGRLYFKQVHSEFIRTIKELNTNVLYTGTLLAPKEGESIIPLNGLRSSQARVVMVFAGTTVAAQMLCYAFHEDMLYPNFQWVFHDRTLKQLVKDSVEEFQVNGVRMSCSSGDMEVATTGVILHQFHLEQENQSMTLPLFGRTYNDYLEDYLEEYLAELENYTEPDNYSNSYHDAVWAMAIALHNASKNGVNLTTYTYNRESDTRTIARYLSRVNFDGMSGPIAFQNETRSSMTIINVVQLWNGNETLIGTYDRSRGKESLKLLEDIGNFTNDTYEVSHVKIHASLGVLQMLFTITLIVFTFLLQLANTFWYQYHSIKATSPNITNLIFSGCYLFSIALLILSVQETFTFSVNATQILYAVLCNLFTWCFLIGYSLIFGTICAKMYRVYRLFRHFSNSRPGHFLSDNALIMFVLILLCIDVVICTTWNVVDPWMVHTTSEPSLNGVPVLFMRSECVCNHVTTWVVTVALYKGSLMIVLVALSILNRRIKRKDFQHTRKINILIYGITMTVGVGMPLYFLLRRRSIYISYILLCITLLSTILLSIFILFLPPVFLVIKMKVTGEEELNEEEKRKRMAFRSNLSKISFGAVSPAPLSVDDILADEKWKTPSVSRASLVSVDEKWKTLNGGPSASRTSLVSVEEKWKAGSSVSRTSLLSITPPPMMTKRGGVTYSNRTPDPDRSWS